MHIKNLCLTLQFSYTILSPLSLSLCLFLSFCPSHRFVWPFSNILSLVHQRKEDFLQTVNIIQLQPCRFLPKSSNKHDNLNAHAHECLLCPNLTSGSIASLGIRTVYISHHLTHKSIFRFRPTLAIWNTFTHRKLLRQEFFFCWQLWRETFLLVFHLSFLFMKNLSTLDFPRLHNVYKESFVDVQYAVFNSKR